MNRRIRECWKGKQNSNVKWLWIGATVIGFVFSPRLEAQNRFQSAPQPLTPLANESSVASEMRFFEDEMGEKWGKQAGRTLLNGNHGNPNLNQWQDDANAIRQIRSQLDQGAIGRLGELTGDQEMVERQFEEELNKLLAEEFRQQQEHELQDLKSKHLTPRQTNRGRAHDQFGLTDRRHPPNKEESRTRNSPDGLRSNQGVYAGQIARGLRSVEQPAGYWQPEPTNRVWSPMPNAKPLHPLATQNSPSAVDKLHGLRGFAKRLEESAAELEELQLYEEADQLRQVAAGMWKKARNPDGSSSFRDD